MSQPWTYTPRPGQSVKVIPGHGGCDLAVCASGSARIDIPDIDAPGVAAGLARAICEAARMPAPVILERPEHPRASIEIAGVTFSVRPGGVEEFRIHGGTQSGTLRSPAEIRRTAARLAALADEAEAGPGPAEVEELAALMDAEMERRANGQYGLYPAVARIALQWMNGRQQRGERS